MANMSYCRMQNTYQDLLDVYENWEYPEQIESEDELKYRQKILELCKDIVLAYEEMEEDED